MAGSVVGSSQAEQDAWAACRDPEPVRGWARGGPESIGWTLLPPSQEAFTDALLTFVSCCDQPLLRVSSKVVCGPV